MSNFWYNYHVNALYGYNYFGVDEQTKLQALQEFCSKQFLSRAWNFTNQAFSFELFHDYERFCEVASWPMLPITLEEYESIGGAMHKGSFGEVILISWGNAKFVIFVQDLRDLMPIRLMRK